MSFNFLWVMDEDTLDPCFPGTPTCPCGEMTWFRGLREINWCLEDLQKFVWNTYSRSRWANKSRSSWHPSRTLVTSWALENNTFIKPT